MKQSQCPKGGASFWEQNSTVVQFGEFFKTRYQETKKSTARLRCLCLNHLV
jgi:hypothetical protein